MNSQNTQWQDVKENYLKLIEQKLAQVDHPRRAEILENVREHLENKYAELTAEQRNWESYQQIITEMGPPEEYSELLSEKNEGIKLTEGEDVLMEMRPELKVLVIWFFTRCLPIGVMICLAIFMLSGIINMLHESEAFAAESSFHGWPIKARLTVGGIAGLVYIIPAFIYCVYLRRTYVYTITNRRCFFRGGILRRVQHSVPFHKITDVEMSQNILERMLGISSLGIYTPGTGSVGPNSKCRTPEIAFVGLKDNETPAEIINKILSHYKATGE